MQPNPYETPQAAGEERKESPRPKRNWILWFLFLAAFEYGLLLLALADNSDDQIRALMLQGAVTLAGGGWVALSYLLQKRTSNIP